ncbi:hypothetical protein COU60_05080 [Candidatus Pacearchaeota archaeon CG10_big_fil_rev_8_21_14_0_10_34_76]|nr:MAG: hypothetical protein COU60_05080 [Candidatus Pacearchaeota archaeon CG10_big_fil_rev_8_21_14_0_10_34_76]
MENYSPIDTNSQDEREPSRSIEIERDALNPLSFIGKAMYFALCPLSIPLAMRESDREFTQGHYKAAGVLESARTIGIATIGAAAYSYFTH